MKKLFTIVCAALVAAVAFADRTASRGWVSGNFAPTNLVPRVEALESVRPSDFWDDDDFLGRALDWLQSREFASCPSERLDAASVLAVIKGMSEAQIAELKDLLK